jgi:hypothetical protein
MLGILEISGVRNSADISTYMCYPDNPVPMKVVDIT